jgi:hypothetical protein
MRCTYEELSSLRRGATSVLFEGDDEGCAVAAPPEGRARVEALVPLLEGDVCISTLAEQRRIRGAVEVIVQCLHSEMEAAVVATHPADELAVAAYFDYAHALAVLGRLRTLGSEMEALIELMTGEPADSEMAAAIVFPD